MEGHQECRRQAEEQGVETSATSPDDQQVGGDNGREVNRVVAPPLTPPGYKAETSGEHAEAEAEGSGYRQTGDQRGDDGADGGAVDEVEDVETGAGFSTGVRGAAIQMPGGHAVPAADAPFEEIEVVVASRDPGADAEPKAHESRSDAREQRHEHADEREGGHEPVVESTRGHVRRTAADGGVYVREGDEDAVGVVGGRGHHGVHVGVSSRADGPDGRETAVDGRQGAHRKDSEHVVDGLGRQRRRSRSGDHNKKRDAGEQAQEPDGHHLQVRDSRGHSGLEGEGGLVGANQDSADGAAAERRAVRSPVVATALARRPVGLADHVRARRRRRLAGRLVISELLLVGGVLLLPGRGIVGVVSEADLAFGHGRRSALLGAWARTGGRRPTGLGERGVGGVVAVAVVHRAHLVPDGGCDVRRSGEGVGDGSGQGAAIGAVGGGPLGTGHLGQPTAARGHLALRDASTFEDSGHVGDGSVEAVSAGVDDGVKNLLQVGACGELSWIPCWSCSSKCARRRLGPNLIEAGRGARQKRRKTG